MLLFVVATTISLLPIVESLCPPSPTLTISASETYSDCNDDTLDIQIATITTAGLQIRFENFKVRTLAITATASDASIVFANGRLKHSNRIDGVFDGSTLRFEGTTFAVEQDASAFQIIGSGPWLGTANAVEFVGCTIEGGFLNGDLAAVSLSTGTLAQWTNAPLRLLFDDTTFDFTTAANRPRTFLVVQLEDRSPTTAVTDVSVLYSNVKVRAIVTSWGGLWSAHGITAERLNVTAVSSEISVNTTSNKYESDGMDSVPMASFRWSVITDSVLVIRACNVVAHVDKARDKSIRGVYFDQSNSTRFHTSIEDTDTYMQAESRGGHLFRAGAVTYTKSTLWIESDVVVKGGSFVTDSDDRSSVISLREQIEQRDSRFIVSGTDITQRIRLYDGYILQSKRTFVENCTFIIENCVIKQFRTAAGFGEGHGGIQIGYADSTNAHFHVEGLTYECKGSTFLSSPLSCFLFTIYAGKADHFKVNLTDVTIAQEAFLTTVYALNGTAWDDAKINFKRVDFRGVGTLASSFSTISLNSPVSNSTVLFEDCSMVGSSQLHAALWHMGADRSGLYNSSMTFRRLTLDLTSTENPFFATKFFKDMFALYFGVEPQAVSALFAASTNSGILDSEVIVDDVQFVGKGSSGAGLFGVQNISPVNRSRLVFRGVNFTGTGTKSEGYGAATFALDESVSDSEFLISNSTFSLTAPPAAHIIFVGDFLFERVTVDISDVRTEMNANHAGVFTFNETTINDVSLALSGSDFACHAEAGRCGVVNIVPSAPQLVTDNLTFTVASSGITIAAQYAFVIRSFFDDTATLAQYSRNDFNADIRGSNVSFFSQYGVAMSDQIRLSGASSVSITDVKFGCSCTGSSGFLGTIKQDSTATTTVRDVDITGPGVTNPFFFIRLNTVAAATTTTPVSVLKLEGIRLRYLDQYISANRVEPQNIRVEVSCVGLIGQGLLIRDQFAPYMSNPASNFIFAPLSEAAQDAACAYLFARTNSTSFSTSSTNTLMPKMPSKTEPATPTAEETSSPSESASTSDSDSATRTPTHSDSHSATETISMELMATPTVTIAATETRTETPIAPVPPCQMAILEARILPLTSIEESQEALNSAQVDDGGGSVSLNAASITRTGIVVQLRLVNSSSARWSASAADDIEVMCVKDGDESEQRDINACQRYIRTSREGAIVSPRNASITEIFFKPDPSIELLSSVRLRLGFTDAAVGCAQLRLTEREAEVELVYSPSSDEEAAKIAADATAAVGAAASLAGGGALMDAQALAVFSLISCSSAGDRYAMKSASFLLSPGSIGDGPEGSVKFNLMVIGLMFATQMTFMTLLYLYKKYWRKSMTSIKIVMGDARFPSWFITLVMMFHQGTTILSLRLIIDGKASFISYFAAGSMFAFPWVVYAYAKKLTRASFDPDISTRLVFFKYEGVGENWPPIVKKVLQATMLPVGRWGPPLMRKRFGGLIGATMPLWTLFGSLPAIQSSAVCLVAAVRADSRAGCVAQFSSLITLYVLFGLSVALYSPFRSRFLNITQTISSLSLAAILALGARLAVFPELKQERKASTGVMMFLTALSMSRMVYGYWLQLAERCLWRGNASKVFWNENRDSAVTRDLYAKLLDEIEMDPVLSVASLPPPAEAKYEIDEEMSQKVRETIGGDRLA